MNYAIYTGRITKDLQLKQTQSGRSVLSFDIAVQRDYKNKQTNEYDADFIPCLAGGTTAEFIANHASKGDYICVSGRMQNNNFTRDDGSTNYGQQLIVRNFDANTLFAANKNDQQSQQRGSYQQNTNNVPQQQRRQAQNGWQQQQQQNNQQPNPFANANGPIDIEDDDLPF
ncbi:single-stranded DNA-binding protein [Staphylococcus haemolyticus]|uniref:single-stranded DNA-binding protein n=1 Tax=Staphylococcus haemolyticus TaxID=1283 RepID=UPI000D1E447A|nr:single-stranded DNA-binding protein [Staphylococcus haemolyticus]PTK51073.1 single-stranded DNA-binding protein [Staphylococcus haemolyticus]